jgi:hypothetical protein
MIHYFDKVYLKKFILKPLLLFKNQSFSYEGL